MEESFFVKLVKRNTGYSSKTFVMLMGIVFTFISQLSLVPLFYIAALNGLVVNWYGIAAVYTAIASLAAVVIYGKVRADVAEYKNIGDMINEDTGKKDISG